MKDIKLTYETLGGIKMENTQHFGQLTERMKAFREEVLAVSYTHLTLPTIIAV